MSRIHRALVAGCLATAAGAALGAEPAVRVTFPAGLATGPLDGRLLVIFATDAAREPRAQVSGDYRSAQVFGIDVEGWMPGESREVGATADGHPLAGLRDLPPGDYQVQALLHRYERVTPAHGRTILVPWDRGEGQQWAEAPGNLLSRPARAAWGLAGSASLDLVLESAIPPLPPAPETEWVKTVRVRSERLSAFWRRDVFLTAFVLLPAQYDAHPDARYPVMLFHGHFPRRLSAFRPEPPDPDLPCERSERFRLDCYNRTVQEEAHRFYRLWSGEGFPRFLAVEIQHPTPFYDDSYAVNSENNGPYGDAITYELLPEIERRFRGVGAPWARFLYGGSTGGWEALAAQILYPDEYNGAFGACPDPVDFHATLLVDLYADENAYRRRGPFGEIAIPSHRDWLGQISSTMAIENGAERALGSRGRSGGQWDGWQSVYSPRGEDGYPAPIFDKTTGAIDREVARYWRDHFDLRHILERDWATLGPKLAGKLHVYVGDMDNYYLNDAVYRLEELLAKADPPARAEFRYGDRFEHCWNGVAELPNAISRLRYHEIYLDRIAARLIETAPPGSGAEGWRRGGRLRAAAR
jgi:hypothetical protein